MKKPKTRGDCLEMDRPCPFITCKHHLWLDVHNQKGNIHIQGAQATKYSIDELADKLVEFLDSGLPTCSLDVADEGPHDLVEISKNVYGGTVSKQALHISQNRAMDRLSNRKWFIKNKLM